MPAFHHRTDIPHSPLIALQRAAAREIGGYVATDDTRLDFRQLEERSNRFANFLRSRGIGRGDRVAGLLHNSMDAIVAWFGTNKCGAIWVPTNTAYTGQWLSHQIEDSDPALLIVERDLADAVYAAGIARPLLIRGDGGDFDSFLDHADAPTDYVPAPSDIGHLIYTSGTTGRAKGCMVSHNYIANYARLGLLNGPRTPDEVLWTPLPLFHIAGTGYVVQTLLLGGRSHFAKGFSLSNFWDQVAAAGASVVPMLGIATTLVATAPDCDAARQYHGKLRVLTGATSPDVRRAIQERFGVEKTLVAAFGQSEGTFITALGDAPYREGTCGVATDSFDVRVVDADDVELPDGEVGEIVYRPRRPDVMTAGYWRNAEVTAKKSRNLWWHSGDFGIRDAEGYFYFTDRGDDRMRRSGENVSSFEIETLFSQHPAISVSAAYAVPSALADDEVMVAVVLRDGHDETPEDLWQWASERMPKFAVPRFIRVETDLPRNPVGKVLKYELRADGVTPTTWDRRNAEGKQ